MRIGKRLFPYPLLNNDILLSQFKHSVFAMKYNSIEIIDEDYVIKGISYICDNNFINQLISGNKAKVVCLIECSETMYRKTFELFIHEQDIIIPLTEINGKITVSTFAIAMEDIPDYICEDFLDDYDGISFHIEKNSIIAVDDGIVDKIQFEGFEDEKKSSIFLVIKDVTIKDGIMQVEYNQNKIIISLPEDQWNKYDKTKSMKGFRNLYFSIIAIPALSQALYALKASGESVDVLSIDYDWFNSFMLKYTETYSEELTDDTFKKLDTYEVAQKMLNLSVTKSVDDIFAIAMGSSLEDEENGN